MTSPQPGRRRARLAPLALAAAVALALGGAPVPDARAADPTPSPSAQPVAADPVRITLTSVEVGAETLTLSGSVTNVGTGSLTDVSVALWRSTALLRSPEAVTKALSAATTTRGTANAVEPSNRLALTDDAEPLPPGASRPFAVAGTLEALGLSETDATWWVGVDVSGAADPNTPARLLSSERTLATRTEGTLPVARVIEFSAPPRQVKKDLFTDEGLVTEITEGRLDELMDLAQEGDGWVVDPALLVELQDMADGYRVAAPTGSLPGQGDAAAAAWLARLAALPGQGHVGLFGSPDLATLTGLGDDTVLDAVRAASGPHDPEGLTPVTVVDHPDAAALTLAASFGRPVIAVDAPAPHVRTETDGTEAVIAHSSALPAPTSALLPDTPVNRRAARFALARAAGGEVRWIRSADDAEDAAALPNGFRRATLAEVVAAHTHPWTPLGPTPGEPALDAARLGLVTDLRERMTRYGEVALGAGVGSLVAEQTARAASRWWVGRADGLDAWLGALDHRLSTPAGAMVTIDATPRFTMTGATSEFPVTVTNHLIDPVTIQLAAVSDNPQRIRLVPPEALTIEPGSSSTVLLQAESAGGGVVRASVHAQTTGGHRLTPDREVVVETTNFGTIGWVIVIVSGVVLVATTAHRIRQVRTKGKGEDG